MIISSDHLWAIYCGFIGAAIYSGLVELTSSVVKAWLDRQPKDGQ